MYVVKDFIVGCAICILISGDRQTVDMITPLKSIQKRHRMLVVHPRKKTQTLRTNNDKLDA